MKGATIPEHPRLSLPRPPLNDDLRLGVKWSFIAHGIFAAVVLIKSFVFPEKSVPYIPTLKVDLVALPDVLKKDLNRKQLNQDIQKLLKESDQKSKKPTEAKASKKTEKASKNEMVIKSDSGAEHRVEKKNKRALERLKALAKLQDIEEAEKASSKKPVPIKGNKLSAGSSLSPDAKESSEADYRDILRDRLQENFVLPPWISRQKFDSQIRIYIDAQGRLKSFKWVKPSGNSQFDDAVKKAIMESQPFPQPPKELHSLLQTDGILLGFPL